MKLWILGFACLLASAPAMAQGILPAGALHISLQPDHLVLGESSSSELTLTVTNAKGQAEDQAPPKLQCSTGHIEGLTRIAPGHFSARYVPPKAGPPSVAIILGRVQSDAGLIAGWARVPLWGKGQVEITTKANAKVLLRIGRQSFGPVDSDDKGHASVDIKVPPGPKEAIAETEDKAGNKSKKTIDLGVGSFNRLAAFALDDTTVADGTEQSGLIAVAVDGRGAPLIDAKIKSKAKRGKTGKIIALAPGVYRAPYISPKKIGKGRDLIKLSLRYDKASRVQVPIALSAGNPSNIRLELSTKAYTAGAQAPILIVHASDASGNSVSASLLRVTTSAGAVLGVAEKLKDQGLRIPIEISNQLDGRDRIDISAKALRGDAHASTHLDLFSGSTAKILISGPKQVIANGEKFTLQVIIQDAYGNPVLLQKDLTINADPLRPGTIQGQGQSTQLIEFVSPELDKAQQVQIRINTKHAKAVWPMRLLPSGGLQARLGPRSLLSWNYGQRWMIGEALDWQLGMPITDDMLWLGGNISLMQSAPASGDNQIDLNVHRLRSAQLMFDANYERQIIQRLNLHAGLGLGANFAVPESKVTTLTHQSDPLIFGISAEAIAGLGLTLGDGQLFCDLRAGYTVPLNANIDPGPLTGISAGLGYRYNL